ncbi:MAG: NUDIX hydrolase [candidate division KSB1 bacterium]|nr:NUDIX hydrolase [candidate division KSB1 bacterium]MDZ7358334.1 NUDIX hydrolase [candidate division KSB1 bacterium]MDZ7399135.1 NUDIX hydrolase [candidate division KSB1 bacterium]
MTRSYPSAPLVGVGVITFNSEGQILLVKRGNEPAKSLWSLPGGLVELGERVRDAGIREVKEECNIDIEPLDVISVVDLILQDAEGKIKYHYVLIDYLAKFVSGELKPQSDVIAAHWFSRDQLADLDIPEVTREVIEKAFKLGLE